MPQVYFTSILHDARFTTAVPRSLLPRLLREPKHARERSVRASITVGLFDVGQTLHRSCAETLLHPAGDTVVATINISRFDRLRSKRQKIDPRIIFYFFKYCTWSTTVDEPIKMNPWEPITSVLCADRRIFTFYRYKLRSSITDTFGFRTSTPVPPR